MFKQLLQAIIDRIKPCQHEWQQIRNITNVTRNGDTCGFEDVYRCIKCCKSKKIKS